MKRFKATWRFDRPLILLSAACCAVGAGEARAVETYEDCISLIATTPDRAEREAFDWARFGGGAPARHCYALSLIAIGAPIRAADELLGIAAEELDLTDDARADILAQAGELLVDNGDLVTATIVAEQAVRLAAASPRPLGLRASVRLANGDLRAALRDLDKAIGGDTPPARLLMLRASANRRLGDLIAARDDISYALERDPEMTAAWLEQGRIEAKLGLKDQARQSLMTAIEGDREGPVGRNARTVLQKMEAGILE